MNTKQLKNVGLKAMQAIGKRSPLILTAMGIGSGFAAVVLTVKATREATDIIEEEKCLRIERDEPEEMTPVEVVKVAWKPFVPVAATWIFSTACVIGSCSVHARRNAALAAAYKVSETALSTFKESAVEELGQKKVNEIQKKAAGKRMEQNPPRSSEVIIMGDGAVLCYDDISGRYFNSDRETIRAAVNDCNYLLQLEMFVSLNDFYERVGLPYTTFGAQAGWNIDQYPFDVLFDTKLTPDGKPCLVVTYNIEPRYDYRG